jgi:hypothetical protein
MVLVAMVAVVWHVVGSSMSDRSEVMTQTKWDILVPRFEFRRGAKHKSIKDIIFLEFCNTELQSKNDSDARRRKMEDFKHK